MPNNLTLLDIAKLNGSDAVVGLIEEVRTVAPEVTIIPARTITGTSYETVARSVLPTVDFRKVNEGTDATKSEFTNRRVETFILSARVEADKAAGEDTSEEEDAIRMLSSEDPMQRQAAISTLHMLTYNSDPDGYKALFPADAKSGWKKEYDDRVATFGKAAADQWAATQDEKFIPVQAGGSVFRATDLMPPQTAEGGDPSTGKGGVPAPALGSNGLPATLTPQQYQAIVNVKGKAATDAYLSQNGIAVENIARGGTAQQPVRVRSVQEARKLPSGTEFITPDGRTMRKP